MKRSRACEDLMALETQKRNKTVGLRPTLLTRSASAEDELSLLVEANALAGFMGASTQHTLHISFDDDDDMDDDVADCLRRLQRIDTRSVSMFEKEVREAKDALASKKLKFIHSAGSPLEMFQNSPDTTDHIFSQDCFFQRRRSAEAAPVFDMSAFIRVLEPNAA